MKFRISVKGGLAALSLAVCTAATSARADTMAFASFADTSANQWTYTGGSLTASTASATFTSFGAPNQLLNYTGAVTYTLNATATGAPTTTGGVIRQPMSGEIIFKNGGTTILDAVFAGAMITGTAGSNSTGLPADTQITGNVLTYSASPTVEVAPFVAPLSFSIALTQIPGISISATNPAELTNFTASASGTFASNSGAGAGTPEPSSLALLSVAGLALLRRRKSGTLAA